MLKKQKTLESIWLIWSIILFILYFYKILNLPGRQEKISAFFSNLFL